MNALSANSRMVLYYLIDPLRGILNYPVAMVKAMTAVKALSNTPPPYVNPGMRVKAVTALKALG